MFYVPIPINVVYDVSIYFVSAVDQPPLYLIPVRSLQRFVEDNWRDIFHQVRSQELNDAAANRFIQLSVRFIDQLVFPDRDFKSVMSKVMAADPDHTGLGTNNEQLCCGNNELFEFSKFMIIMGVNVVVAVSFAYLSFLLS
jgi:hypothetical protein